MYINIYIYVSLCIELVAAPPNLLKKKIGPHVHYNNLEVESKNVKNISFKNSSSSSNDRSISRTSYPDSDIGDYNKVHNVQRLLFY